MTLDQLTDDELMQHAYVHQDSLTSTPLELELRTRLAQALDTLDDLQPLADALGEFDPITPGELRELLERAPDGDLAKASALLGVLAEEELTDPKGLRAALVLLGKLKDLTDDPEAALDALETLFNTATA